ncbi:unnamed protein product [Rotaria socialis]|uniref:Uncharacterized protein n=1 Tax=Rotaria socialis TaxID=392032 RepID=A0A818V623_9BILA|nr:unnamed protein product [Rotaria socialis]CAF3404886.1 unnamed protein product [Rotaria socialis]CAF3501331.1 unnamed protein product [Rotaria socialis]CAF3645398.1 unnamed protein product [Rotaria socialis]CAF3710500.1 unnamed protein product [Rotaria socialis]
MKNNQFALILLVFLLLVWHSAAIANIGAIYCMQEVNNKVVDACRNIDLNGDGFDDILITSGIPNGKAYAELINLKGNGFCVKRQIFAYNLINDIPPC